VRIPDFSDAQRCLLEVVYDGFLEASSWPTSAYVDTILDHDYSLDYEAVLADLPLSVVIPSSGYGQQSFVKLTVAGTNAVEAAAPDVANFLALVVEATRRESQARPHPNGVAEFELDDGDADQIWGRQLDKAELARLLEITYMEGINAGSRGLSEDGEWSLTFNRRIRPYRGVEGIGDYLDRRPEPIAQSWTPPLPATPYIFILMPFEADWSKNVKDVIAQACLEASRQFAGLRWERSDDITETGRITGQIVTAIERADVLIADITETNPNVLFELGYADAFGRPVVVLNQAISETPFDIKDWRQIEYTLEDLATLRLSLVDFLVATLRRQGFQAPAPAEN
jgi:hypothetical protein